MASQRREQLVPDVHHHDLVDVQSQSQSEDQHNMTGEDSDGTVFYMPMREAFDEGVSQWRKVIFKYLF